MADLEAEYHAYLLQFLYMDLDTFIDCCGDLLSFEEWKEGKEAHDA